MSHVVLGCPEPHGGGRRLLFGQVPLPELLLVPGYESMTEIIGFPYFLRVPPSHFARARRTDGRGRLPALRLLSSLCRQWHSSSSPPRPPLLFLSTQSVARPPRLRPHFSFISCSHSGVTKVGALDNFRSAWSEPYLHWVRTLNSSIIARTKLRSVRIRIRMTSTNFTYNLLLRSLWSVCVRGASGLPPISRTTSTRYGRSVGSPGGCGP